MGNSKRPRIWPVVIAILALSGVAVATVFSSAISFSKRSSTWAAATGSSTGEGMYDNNGIPVWHRDGGAEFPMIGGGSGGGSGGVALVATGAGLTGGPIISSGTISVADGGVTPNMMGPSGVTPGSYTNLNATVNAAGQLTSASNGSGGISGLTTGTFTIATSSTTIGNGPIAQSAGVINVTTAGGTSGAGSVNIQPQTSGNYGAWLSLDNSVEEGAGGIWSVANFNSNTSFDKAFAIVNGTSAKQVIFPNGDTLINYTVGDQGHALTVGGDVQTAGAGAGVIFGDGTHQTSAGITASSLASTQVAYGNGTSSLTSSANMTFSGTALALNASITQGGGAFSLTGTAASQITTSSGTTTLDSAGNVNVGASTATGVLIGRTGVTVAVAGNNLNFGDATTTQRILAGTQQGTNDTAGAAMLITTSQGGNASATGGGLGGAFTSRGGSGGTGVSALNPGSGGTASLLGGNGGTGGTGNSSGGNVLVDGGLKQGTGTGGTVQIGTGANTAAVSMGRSGITSTITGALTQLTGAFSLTGNAQSQLTTTAGSLVLDSAGTAIVDIGVTTTSAIAVGRSGITTTLTGALTQLTGAVSLTGNAASSFTTSSGALTLTSAAAATWSVAQSAVDTVGSILRLNGGAGGIYSATGAGIGGNILPAGGAGGAGDATHTGAAGGVGQISGGAGGLNNGGGGGNGGNGITLGGTGAVANGASTGANGGSGIVGGGSGGAGSATGTSGAGGPFAIVGGAAGTNAGGGGANGGSGTIRGGAGSGAGTNGTITIGDINTAAVNIGSSSIITTILGILKVIHLAGASSAVTFTASTGAGTTPTVTIAGTDLSGKLSLTTGSAPAASNASIGTINFNVAYATAPNCTFSPGNANAAGLTGTTSIFTTTATGTMGLTAGSTALAAATPYIWFYTCSQ